MVGFWGFQGGNGQGRNLCRSCVGCLILQEEPGGRKCHRNPSWEAGDCGEYRKHLPLLCGCLAELMSIVQKLRMWDQRRRRISIFGVSQALVQPENWKIAINSGPFHK